MNMAGHAPVATLALVIACLAVYVALDLAERAAESLDWLGSRLSACAGAAVMGTGVWSMHFVGMSAVDYPFKAGFAFGATFFSWAAAVAVCLIPVGLAASRARGRAKASWTAACVTSAGLVAMHLVGASAMETLPSPNYDPAWLAAALACAAFGCGLGLSGLKSGSSGGAPARSRSALFIGAALAGMHFLAMAAASFAPGTICTSQVEIDAGDLSQIVGAVTLAFLGLMLLMSTLERRAQRLSADLRHSLAFARDEIERVSLSDAATGLPNRLVFQEALGQAAARADETGAGFAVLIVDIDEFARVERALAPESANAALRACAARVVAAAGPAHQVASAGGHQFLILHDLPEPSNPDLALRIAARVGAEMRVPFDAGDARRLTASVGISVYPADGTVKRLVGNASMAMEAVARRGGNSYAFFEPAMDIDAHAATALVEDLRLAVSRRELALHYQPKVHAASGQIAGVEALLRWRHPTRGMVGPAEFIPLAERFGLVNELGDWVVAEAVRQMAAWADEGLRLRVAVNVSPGQLLQPDFAGSVVDALARAGVDPGLLTCEITESGAMQDAKATMATFERLETAGVQLSIDDFGTGYSSLSHLRKIPLRQLKVDRSFVSDLQDSADARSIVAAIIGMAHALRLEVVAEGVETAEQRDILMGMGCDKFQGYLFARPMPAEQLTDLMLGIGEAQRQFRDSIFVS